MENVRWNMDPEVLFRVVLLMVIIGYIVPRTYFRRKASQSNRPGESDLQNVTESKVRLALLGVSGLSADLLSVVWAIKPTWLSGSSLLLPNWLRWVGVALGAVAVWLGYLSLRTLGTNYTATLKTKENHHIVVEGIYGWIRHPMYTSFFALLAAYLLLSANWLIGMSGLIYSLLILERTGHEERVMLNAFGEEYGQYMQRTGRFFPRL
jgi:protein-S-isoprenylcysteine O-methyltransferase Ste14